MKIGHGYDAHRFAAGRPLILGGVKIPHDRGLAGHSDGDAVIHALSDALLGAMALGDIGTYFPDSDSAYKDIDSRILLRKVVQLLHERNCVPVNVDVTVLAQAPRLGGYIQEMRRNLAEDLGLDISFVNVKATTTDGLGFIGHEEGIAAHAVALIAPSG